MEGKEYVYMAIYIWVCMFMLALGCIAWLAYQTKSILKGLWKRLKR